MGRRKTGFPLINVSARGQRPLEPRGEAPPPLPAPPPWRGEAEAGASQWTPRALALGQQEGPELANMNILQDGLSPKTATQQISKVGPARLQSLCGALFRAPPPHSFVPSGHFKPPVPSVLLHLVVSLGSPSFLPPSLTPAIPHPPHLPPLPRSGVEVRPPPRTRLAVPASPRPAPARTRSFPSQQAEAPEALIRSHFKVFLKAGERYSVNK